MQLASGKKVFEHIIAKYQIPLRTKEEVAVVEGTLFYVPVHYRMLIDEH